MSEPSAAEVFLEFREQAIWLQTCYDIHRALFESDESTSQLLRDTAPAFFRDINLVLVEYVLLQIGRLTDPPSTHGRANLTVAHINELLVGEGKFTPVIAAAADGLQRYRNLMVESRNRVVAHADRDTLLANVVVGTHSRNDVVGFFDSLYSYIDHVGIALNEGPLDITSTSSSGDALDLLAFLRHGLQLVQSDSSALHERART